MSPDQQKEIVRTLCDGVRDRLLQKIEDLDVPEEWDGIELRQLVAESFWHERTLIGKAYNPNSKRVKEFRTTVILNNLDR